jgi:hypothetical protein
MNTLGLTSAANQIKLIVDSVDYLKQGQINYTEFLIACIQRKQNMDE